MRSRALAFGCLLIGGALALVGSAQPWWRATGAGCRPRVQRDTGHRWTEPSARHRRAGWDFVDAGTAHPRTPCIGTLLLLVGLGLAVVGGFGLQPSADAVGSEVRAVSLADTFQLRATVWPWVFAVSGVLVTIGAVLTIITAGTWPARSERLQPGSEQGGGSGLRGSGWTLEGNGCGR